MLGMLLCAVGLAGSARVVYEVGPAGVSVRSITPLAGGDRGALPSDGDLGTLDVVGPAGRPLGAVGLEDPRLRTVITPDGGEVAHLPSALGRVTVPWEEGSRLWLGDRALDPRFVDPAPGMAPPPAEGVVAVQSAGDPSQRLDLVLLGDGYRASEMGTFAADVDRVAAYLASIEPWSRYTGLLNVWRVEVPSNESGASHDELGTRADTAFDCAYGCGGIDRLICCDEGKVLDAAARVGAYDGVLVLVNDPTYGGSGGFTYATAYTGSDYGTQVAAHELGHSLVGLHDEYSYGYSAQAPHGPNCTVKPEDPEWDQWLGVDGVDAYAECSYTNHWRPTDNGCMMRTLSDGYCPVCREAAVLAMYGKVPDIVTASSPDPGTAVDATGDLDPEISVSAVVDDLAYEWTVDGAPIDGVDGPIFHPRCSGVNGDVSVRVVDETPWVREDPQDLLASSAGPWTVTSEKCKDFAPDGETPAADSGVAAVASCEGCASAGSASWAWILAIPLLRRRR